MTKFCGLGIVLLAVAGCAGAPSDDAQNPFNYCVQKGLEQATAEFNTCVSGYIAQLCTEAGHAQGSQAYGQCVQELQESAFTRQQLQMRGF